MTNLWCVNYTAVIKGGGWWHKAVAMTLFVEIIKIHLDDEKAINCTNIVWVDIWGSEGIFINSVPYEFKESESSSTGSPGNMLQRTILQRSCPLSWDRDSDVERSMKNFSKIVSWNEKLKMFKTVSLSYQMFYVWSYIDLNNQSNKYYM